MRFLLTIFLFLGWLFAPLFSNVEATDISWERVFEGTVNGQRLAGAYSGGQDLSYPAFADVDNDGDYDLLVGSQGERDMFFYRNDGTPDSAYWTLVTDNLTPESCLPAPTFVDIDSDQDFDLFIGDCWGRLRYYCNEGTPESCNFSLVTTEYNSIDVGQSNSPAFVDIDDDNDYDLFIGELYGQIYFYRNDGDVSNPIWTFMTWTYDSIDVGFHSVPKFVDIDADGDYDMLVGENDGNINFFLNFGNADSAQWTLVTENFGSINVGGRSTPSFVDIDDDNDYDLFVGEPHGNVNYYRNDGNSITPTWTTVAEYYLTMDVGLCSAPALVDINADGDYDLFIGEYDGNINCYENKGSSSEPDWWLFSQNFNSIYVGERSSPAFVDIDADGDYDLFIGNAIGRIYFYRNDGKDSSALWTYVTDSYNFIDVGSLSSPAFVDIDADGDCDLFIGEDDGNINFYRNDGNAQIPAWTFVTPTFSSIDFDSPIYPAFADLDDDGDYDLLAGPWYGRIFHYENIGTPDSALFILKSDYYDSIDVGGDCIPAFVDIDDDGDLDMFTGEWAGGINFYRNLTFDAVDATGEEKWSRPSLSLAQNYPNPFNQSTQIQFSLKKGGFVTLNVYDLLGRKVRCLISEPLSSGDKSVLWDGKNDSGKEVASGIYFYQLKSGDYIETKKMLLLK